MTRRKTLPLTAVRAFEAAARLGRLTLAADELGVTHGAVSRQVRQLDEYLGVDLFAGPRSKPVLTPSGQALLPALTAALDQIDAAVRMVISGEEGVLQVACFSTFAMRWLIPRLHRFSHANPNIDVRLSTDDRRVDLIRGRFDLVIMALDAESRVEDGDAVLFPERLGVVLAPALVPPSRRLAKDGLATVPRLATRTRLNAWPMWDALAGTPEAEAKARPVAQFEHYTFTIEAALSALGAAAVPWHLVADDVASGRLAAPFGFKSSGYRYIARTSQPASRRAKRFRAWLQHEAAMQEEPPT